MTKAGQHRRITFSRIKCAQTRFTYESNVYQKQILYGGARLYVFYKKSILIDNKWAVYRHLKIYDELIAG